MTTARAAVAAAVRTALSIKPTVVSGISVCVLALATGRPDTARAQETSLEEVTVTGSRIRRTTDFDTANPTTVVDSSFLQELGIVNVGEALSQLPANVSNNSPTTTGNANFFAGSTIANLRGLNPFFGSRTLTLVNTRRFVPTNQGDGVDLNFIPSTLIERVDVVTGGASAAYGSGAVSGVNNIFLNRKLEGGKFDVDFYQTGQGDGDDRHMGVAYGTSLFEGRGHLVVGGEWQKTDAVGCIENRDWCREGTAFISTGVTPTGAGDTPANVLRSNVRANQTSYSGVFNNFIPGATQTLQLNEAGTGVVPFNIGSGNSTTPFYNVVGGDGRSVFEYTNLSAPIDRAVGAATFTFAVSDTVNLNVDLSHGKVETTNITGALDGQLNTISADNAFVVNNAALAAVVGPGASLNKDWTSQLDSHSTFTTKVSRAAVGLDGTFGDSTWGWDTYFQYGKTEREQLVYDNRHLNAYLMAIDSVLDSNGNAVCRVTRDGFAAASVGRAYAAADPRIAQGCVALNPFGTGEISQAAHDYAFGYLNEKLDYTQQVLAANASGEVWKGVGAGPFALAVGAELRKEKGENIGSQGDAPDYVRTDYLIQYGESFSGKVDVVEGYFEFDAPLLRDKPGARTLNFNLAARQSQYKNQGLAGTTGESRTHDMFTWKGSLVWDPVDWMRVRSTKSRDSRAANFRELYYGQIIHAGGSFGYCGPTGTVFADPCTFSLEGNVDLKPEKADTTTFGLVFTPADVVPGLQFAADYFKIEISDAIQQANSRRVLDGCQISGLAEYCALIVPDVAGVYTYNPTTGQGIETIRALSFNGSGYSYKGVDFTGSFTMPLKHEDNLSFRLLATRMIDQKFQSVPGAAYVNVVGQTGTSNSFLSDNQPSAKWMANLSTTYSKGPMSLTGQVRYVSEGIMNYLGVTPDDASYPTTPAGGTTLDRNRVPSYAVFSLSGSYQFQDVGVLTGVQLFASLENLFDRDPPIASGTGFGGGNGGTNPIFYDTMGRAFRLGVRTTF